jgi:hypothetical protein
VRYAAPAPVGAGVSTVLGAARAVLAVVGGAMIFTRWTGRKGPATNGFLRLHGHAMDTLRRAQEDGVRERARRQILEFGELLGHSASQPTHEAAMLVQRALDAYDAAERTLDRSRDITDLAGALVLVREGRDALGAARAAARGKKPPATVPLCFFNPLHGISARTVVWQPPGEWGGIKVRSCDECAKRVRRRQQPDALCCQVHGHDIPYYRVHNVWAATGYGQLCDDLIERVLAGQ